MRTSHKFVFCRSASTTLFSRPALSDALEHCEVIEQVLRADFGIDAELLRQVAERLAYFVLLVQHVDLTETNGALVRILQCGEDAHQRGLSCAVGTEQAVHPGRNGERHVLQRLHAVGVRLRDAANS